MLPIRTILHPTDFSGPSEGAFQLACSLARDHGARLIVLHVMFPPVVAYGEMMAELADHGDRGKLEERLRQLVQGAPPQVRVERRLEEVGDPAEVIVRLGEVRTESAAETVAKPERGEPAGGTT